MSGSLPSTLHAAPALRWIPSLAGVRGLSILLVMGFHLGLPLPAGGPVGVTIFFVLSGFLITRVLLAERAETGRIALLSFYIRRTRRLAPTLIVAVIVVAVIAMAAGQVDRVVHDSVLALTYGSNWARAGGDLMGVWNHAWSLAIEEQFYLAWPVALIVLARIVPPGSRGFIALLVGIAIGSAVLRVALIVGGASGDRIYFGSDTRAEALLAGCALACLSVRRPTFAISRWAGPASIAALVGMAAAPVGVEPWPGAIYSFVALGSCVLIWSVLGPGDRPTILASRPMVWIGERSYSLYIWHVPVIVGIGTDLAGSTAALRFGVPLLISIVLAVASYELVERPFRWPRRSGRRPGQARRWSLLPNLERRLRVATDA